MSDLFSLEAIGERLRTQDNRITAQPIFMVQERFRVYGVQDGYEDGFEWSRGEEYDRVSPDAARGLERRYQQRYTTPRGFHRIGYKDFWQNVQPFFTDHAARLYIKNNGHNHGPLRTYAESAYRNHEWNAVREWLMKPPAADSANAGKSNLAPTTEKSANA